MSYDITPPTDGMIYHSTNSSINTSSEFLRSVYIYHKHQVSVDSTIEFFKKYLLSLPQSHYLLLLACGGKVFSEQWEAPESQFQQLLAVVYLPPLPMGLELGYGWVRQLLPTLEGRLMVVELTGEQLFLLFG